MRAFLLLLSLGAFSTRVAAIGGDAHDARVHPRHAHAVLKDGRAVAPGTKPDASACSSPSSTITSAPASSPTLVARAACASSYRGFTMITGTGTLPKPTSFVKRSARTQMLSLDGVAFRVVGPNIYWLCQDENVNPVGANTDKGRIREALAIAVAMGANTVRAISCGVSVGNQYSIEPTLNSFAAQWDAHDYAIYAAGQYGLRLILPLTDNYQYYHGGKYTFLNWRGVSTANGGYAFYTNPTVISDFQNYVRTFLSHRNPYNGLTYAQDPTILAIETGNELGGYIGADGYPPAAWTNTIINTIRAVDTQHLILDGTNGFYKQVPRSSPLSPANSSRSYTTKETSAGLTIPAVDIVSDHGYPRNNALLASQIPLASRAVKPFLIGEWDWTDNFGGDSVASYISAIESAGQYLGDMIWNVMGHDAQCCNYVPHYDGYSLYYPKGNTVALQANILKVVQHWYRVTKRPIPRNLYGVTCPQPVF